MVENLKNGMTVYFYLDKNTIEMLYRGEVKDALIFTEK